jgi:hypothetical protein
MKHTTMPCQTLQMSLCMTPMSYWFYRGPGSHSSDFTGNLDLQGIWDEQSQDRNAVWYVLQLDIRRIVHMNFGRPVLRKKP